MITFLTILVYLLKIVEVVVVLTVTLLCVDFICFYYTDEVPPKRQARGKHAMSKSDELKARLRQQKETEARGGFFEESYVTGFDPTGALYESVVNEWNDSLSSTTKAH